jgi:hypothetical protein
MNNTSIKSTKHPYKFTFLNIVCILPFIISGFSLKSIYRHNNSIEIIKDNVPGIPPLRAHHALVYDEANKCILLTAGSTPLNGGSSFVVYNDLWCFSGNGWKEMGEAGDERSGIRLVYDSKRGKIFSFGGYSEGNSLADLRMLEGGTWKTISVLPEMKASEPGFVYDTDRDRFIVFGGSAARGIVNAETWEWDGVLWKKITGPGPGGRQAFSMIYDSKRKKTVLYGGMGTSPSELFNDTWEFDGTRWTKVADTGPGTRMSPGYAYDSKRNILIIFGGFKGDKRDSETWGWDGKEWKQLATTGPSPRAMGYMAYDKERDKIVLFGGRLGWPNDANDTWEWNGTAWKEIIIK